MAASVSGTLNWLRQRRKAITALVVGVAGIVGVVFAHKYDVQVASVEAFLATLGVYVAKNKGKTRGRAKK